MIIMMIKNPLAFGIGMVVAATTVITVVITATTVLSALG
jgi:hypothetical protein